MNRTRGFVNRNRFKSGRAIKRWHRVRAAMGKPQPGGSKKKGRRQ